MLLLFREYVVAVLNVFVQFYTQGSTPTWEEFCGRDTQYLESMRAVLKHEYGQGGDGNGMELYFSTSERQGGKVARPTDCCLYGMPNRSLCHVM